MPATMSEPPPSNNDDPSKKGKRKNLNTYAQKGLGSFGIKRSKKIVDRGEVEDASCAPECS
jgi:hypothetical protein